MSVLNRREALKRVALLLGASLTPSTLTSVFAEVSRDPQSGPRYLTVNRFATISAFAEHLLPRSNTPGAAEVGVPQFIDTCWGQFLSSDERARLADGLAALDADCVAHSGHPFTELSPTARDAAFLRLSENQTTPHRAFLKHLRELTLVGYFTSEIVGKTVLNYDPVPGRFDPCISVQQVDHIAWTEG